MRKLIKRKLTGGSIYNTGASSTAANYTSVFNGGGFSGINGIGNIIGMGSSVIGSFIPSRSEYNGSHGAVTQGLDTAYDTAANTVSSINPLAGGIMKGGAMLGKAVGNLGEGTDGMTTTDAILGSSFFNLSSIGLINGFGGKRSHTLTQGLNERDAMKNVGSSYGGTIANWLDAASKSGKKYGAFSSGARKKANRLIDKAETQMDTMLDISTNAETRNLLANYMGDVRNQNYLMKLLGGYNPRTLIGKSGIKILDLDRVRNIIKLSKGKKLGIKKALEGFKFEEDEDLEFIPNGEWSPKLFLNGGDINIIPEGALHARKNNMETPNITKKGIPVIDNEGKQLAEIEKNEIIFRKEVTDKIEELEKDGSDDAAIECGKLLTLEIFENTEDRTGLIKEVISAKNGTKLALNGLDIPKIDPSKLKNTNLNTDISSLTLESINKDIDNKAFLLGVNKNILVNGAIDTVEEIAKAFSNKTANDYNLKVQNNLEKLGFVAGNNILQLLLFLLQKELLLTQNPELYNQYFGSERSLLIANMKAADKINPLSIVNAAHNLSNLDKELKLEETTPVYNAEDGAKIEKEVEVSEKEPKEYSNRKYKTYEEWKNYLNSTGRYEDPDYDNKGFYNDDETYNKWLEEEEKTPGKAHFGDEYKLPSYMTFSIDSKYNDKDHLGGSWTADNEGDIFITSPYLEKLHSLQDYLNWLPIHDNNIKNIIYNGTKYHIGRKNK